MSSLLTFLGSRFRHFCAKKCFIDFDNIKKYVGTRYVEWKGSEGIEVLMVILLVTSIFPFAAEFGVNEVTGSEIVANLRKGKNQNCLR